MDNRSKKVVILSHCILNQNSVVNPLARAKGAYKEIVKTIMDFDIGIHQLPCPEMIFLGMERKSMSRNEYDTKDYHDLCKDLSKQTLSIIQNYEQNGYEIVGLIGINHSPTCSINGESGIFMEEFLSLLKNNGIKIPMTDVSTNYVEGKDNEKEIEKLKSFLRN